MKFLSGLIALLVTAFAVSFAIANGQSAKVTLWPFGVDIEAPLYLLTLGTLFIGLLLGAVIGWLNAFPHRMEARRLRTDIAELRGKIESIQQAGVPQRRREDRIATGGGKWRFWKTGS
jgi:uncharacterized integral membrane protein